MPGQKVFDFKNLTKNNVSQEKTVCVHLKGKQKYIQNFNCVQLYIYKNEET